MTSQPQRADCLPAEMIASFAEGQLRRSDIETVVAHLDTCPDCAVAAQAAVDFASAHREEVPIQTGSRWRVALAAAAMIAVVLAAGAWLLTRWRGSDAEGIPQLAALAPRSARLVEPRLAGEFAWAPYRGPMRNGDEGTDRNRLRLTGAAAEAAERANAHPSAESQRVAGIAFLLIDDPAAATARLRAATARDPRNAAAWSDLAAAEYALALRREQPSALAAALTAADQALRLDARRPAALFNRALILERLGRTEEARTAWRAYLEHDASSPWRAEAEEHLKQLR